MNYGCFNRIWASLDCIRSWRCLNDPNLVTRLLLPGIIRGEQVSRFDISDTISHLTFLSAQCSPLSQDRSAAPHVPDISQCDHTPQATQTGPGSWVPLVYTNIHSTLALLSAESSMTIPVSFIIPSNNRLRLDKYLLDVFLSWLWSLMCLITLCRHDGNYLCISENCWWQKSHFIHDKVPGWRLLIKWRLGPLNQHQWGLAWA